MYRGPQEFLRRDIERFFQGKYSWFHFNYFLGVHLVDGSEEQVRVALKVSTLFRFDELLQLVEDWLVGDMTFED